NSWVKSSTKYGSVSQESWRVSGPPRSRGILLMSYSNEAVRQVYDWLLQGASLAEIAEASAKEFPAYPVHELVRLAKEQLIAEGNRSPEELIAWAKAASLNRYGKFITIGDYSGALKGVAQIAEWATKQ